MPVIGYVRRFRDDRDDYNSRWAVVRDGTLVEFPRIDMEDLLCPEHAEARAAYRRQQEEERLYAISRGRKAGMQVGVYKVAKSDNHIYVVRATAREYWWRHARPEEIAEYQAAQEMACDEKSDGVRL